MARPRTVGRKRPNIDAIISRLLAERDDDRRDCKRTAARVDSELARLGPTILAKLIQASNKRRNH